MNEPDACALEERLRLKEKHGGEVVVCSAGPARVCAGDPRGAGARRRSRDPRRGRRARRPPTRSSSRSALAAAMKDEQFDLMLTGPAIRRSGLRADRRHPGGAARPAARDDHHGSAGERAPRLRVKRELEGGWFQWVAMPLPAVLTIQSGINQLRYATLKGHHGGEKEGRSRRRPPLHLRGAPEDRVASAVPEDEADAAHIRLAGRSHAGAGARVTRRGEE